MENLFIHFWDYVKKIRENLTIKNEYNKYN